MAQLKLISLVLSLIPGDKIQADTAIERRILQIGGKVSRDATKDGNPISGLAFDNCRLWDDDLLAIIKCLPGLRRLEIVNCPITDRSLDQIGRVQSLEYLNLRGTQRQ